MKRVLARVIYLYITIMNFLVLWKVTGRVWETFVPLNSTTNLVGLVFVTPVIVIASFVFTGVMFHWIRKGT
ncbi:hypothetical protein EQV77_04380 [Halobacillus fulvus]|nr:hypothetical protein EQV77_04380 [Halobacillus fulvus]